MEDDMLKESKLWKITYATKPPTSTTFYLEALGFTEALAYALAAITHRHPPENAADDILDRLEGILVEAVEPLVVSTHNVEIKHYDTVPM